MGPKIVAILGLFAFPIFLTALDTVPSDEELEAAIQEEISTKEAKAIEQITNEKRAIEKKFKAKVPTQTSSMPASDPVEIPTTQKVAAPKVQKTEAMESGFTQTSGTPPLSLSDTFNLEKNPGRGTFTLKKAPQNEVVDLGPPGAQYGYGLVFRHQTLPEELMKQYGTVDVILFSFGTLTQRLEGKAPEFANLMLFTKSKPGTWKTYPVGMGGKDKHKEFGLLLVTSPTALSQRTDEERLKDTYFSKAGSIKLTSSGPAKGLDIPIQEKNLSFKVQPMKLVVEAELSTPFNAEKRHLSLNAELPVYWPESPAALTWIKKIAETSLSQSNQLKPVNTPRALSSKSP